MAIQEAVHGLSPKEKTIFTYRMIGLHDAEISKTLGISVSDVRTTVYRVRQKLHRALREEGFEFGLAGSDNGR